jgi:hypothetical protein
LLRLRRWLPGVLAAAAGLTGPIDVARAQPAPATMPVPGMPGSVAPPANGGSAAAPAGPPEKLVSIHFEKAGWDEVLDWYAKETGLTLITTVKPTGTVAIKPGKDRKFTIGEVTDLINEAMMQQKFLLIRRHMTFFIQPSDEKIDATLLPRVTVDELKKRGRTEIVQVVLPVEGMVVTDSLEELKRLLTPFGTLVPLEKPNAYLIQDTVGNIERLQKTLDEIADKNKGADSLNHVCEYRRPQEIAETLAKLMANQDTKIDLTGTQPPQPQPGADPRFGGGDPRWGGDPRFGGFNRGAPAATGGGRVKTVQIAVDARRNAILVTAPQDKIGLAKKIIEDADKPLYPGQPKLVAADPVLKTYTVPAGSAADLAKTIQTRFPWVQTIALPAQNQVMVLAAPVDLLDIGKIISGGGDGVGGTADRGNRVHPARRARAGRRRGATGQAVPDVGRRRPDHRAAEDRPEQRAAHDRHPRTRSPRPRRSSACSARAASPTPAPSCRPSRAGTRAPSTWAARRTPPRSPSCSAGRWRGWARRSSSTTRSTRPRRTRPRARRRAAGRPRRRPRRAARAPR